MNPYSILVNKTHPVPEAYLSAVELVSVCGVDQQQLQVERQTLAAFEALAAYVRQTENTLIGPIDAYRSLEDQRQIYTRFRELYGKDYADRIVAPVGTSEHHLGICIDLRIYIPKEGFISPNDHFDRIRPLFEKHVHPHLSRFGFILRYPFGKESVTGYPYEPWHIRYVGCDAAWEITQRGLTLEEWAQTHNIAKERMDKV